MPAGDGRCPGALAELGSAATIGCHGSYRQQLLADTQTIALALLTHRPDLPGWDEVNDWLTGELGNRMTADVDER